MSIVINQILSKNYSVSSQKKYFKINKTFHRNLDLNEENISFKPIM